MKTYKKSVANDNRFLFPRLQVPRSGIPAALQWGRNGTDRTGTAQSQPWWADRNGAGPGSGRHPERSGEDENRGGSNHQPGQIRTNGWTDRWTDECEIKVRLSPFLWCFQARSVTLPSYGSPLGNKRNRVASLYHILLFLFLYFFLFFINVCVFHLESIMVAFRHFTNQSGLRHYLAVCGSVAHPSVLPEKKKVIYLHFFKKCFFLLWMSSLIYLLFCFYLNRRINWCSLWQDSNESLHCWAAASFVLIKVICFCTSKKETWSKEREESRFWAKHECFWFIRTVVNYCSFSIISLTLAPLHKFSTIFLAVQEMLLY